MGAPTAGCSAISFCNTRQKGYTLIPWRKYINFPNIYKICPSFQGLVPGFSFYSHLFLSYLNKKSSFLHFRSFHLSRFIIQVAKLDSQLSCFNTASRFWKLPGTKFVIQGRRKGFNSSGIKSNSVTVRSNSTTLGYNWLE